MIRNKIAKIAGLSVGITLVLGGVASTANAQTVAELQAQINALMAQLAALSGGSMSTGTTFTQNLTVGSSGAQVTALQQMLVAQGHLVMPAGVAMGYFGNLTKAAVAKWQAANGISPAAGYFGPISRAKANAGGTVPGTTVGGSTGVITTPGVEGTITVSKAPTPASGVKLYEMGSKVGVLGIKLEAKTSDIKIERIKLDLDCSTCSPGGDQDFYRKIAQRIYIMDGSTVLGWADLSNSTVVEDGSDYFITIAGLNYVVPKDATRTLTVALDGRSSWDSTYNGDSWQVTVPVEGVRGVDGAGVNQYSPASAFNNTFTSEDDILETATLNLSTNANTPQDMEKVCTSGADEDECDQLELLRFDVRAEKDTVTLTDLTVNIQKTGTGSASSTSVYLMDGSTVIGSETVLNHQGANSAVFDDIDYVIAKDSTKTLSVKIDIIDSTINASAFSASTTGSLATAENSAGSSITESGSATGETVVVRKIGPEFTLVSKSISYGGTPGFSGATTTAKADFVIRMKAVGGDIVFGDSASTTYPLIVLGLPTGATASSSVIYRGGADVNTATANVSPASDLVFVASSTSITVPSGVTATTSNSWTLSEGNTIDIPVSMVFNSRYGAAVVGAGDVTTGAYAVQINRLFWSTATDVGERHVSDFMSTNSGWRTGTVTLP